MVASFSTARSTSGVSDLARISLITCALTGPPRSTMPNTEVLRSEPRPRRALPRFATHEGFVNLDYALQRWKVLDHKPADLVRDAPRALVGDAKLTLKFCGGDAVPAG